MKITRAELEDRFNQLTKHNTLFMQAFNDMACKRVTWFHKAKYPGKRGARYRFGVSRITGAAGGILIYVVTQPGQPDCAYAYYLDDCREGFRHEPVLRSAIELAFAMREQAICDLPTRTAS